ncbi:hypothetical protein C0993_012317, partial [Termitomyces sp. T159_Od127]
SLSEHLKSTFQTGDHSKNPVNTVTALRSIRPKLTRLFTSSLKSSPSTKDADATRERLSPPSPAVISTEVGTTTLGSERSHEEPISTDKLSEPFCGPLPKGRSEAVKTWVINLLDEYSKPEKGEYRRWMRAHRVAEWRRYRSRRRIVKSQMNGSDRHEILVVKLMGQSETEAVFLQFERYTRDRRFDNADGQTYRPLAWQVWQRCYPDDRVTMLEEWPDESRYLRCEEHIFHQKEHKVSFMDLLITAHLVADAPWTDFWSRHDHWFAVLLGRTLNGKMEKMRRLKQPVAIGVVEKYGKHRRWDCFRVSTLHERRKIVELIHLCSVASHREKVRLVSLLLPNSKEFHADRYP